MTITLNGWLTYIAAGGLAAMACYQIATGDQEGGLKTFGQAMALIGLRRAVGKVEAKQGGG